MTLIKANPDGWSEPKDSLTVAQMNTVQDEYSKAIDGYGGGTYNPTSVINIGGSGFSFSVATYFLSSITEYGTAYLLGDTHLGNSPTDTITSVAGASLTQGTWVCSDSFSLSADNTCNTFTFSNAVEFDGYTNFISTIYGSNIATDGNIDAQGHITAQGNLTAAAAFTCSGSAQFNGNVGLGSDSSDTTTINSNVTLNGIIAPAAGGRVAPKLIVESDGNKTLAVGTGQNYLVNAGVLSTNRTYTLSTTGAVDGDLITLTNLDPTFYITGLPGADIHYASGFYFSKTFIFSSGAWYLFTGSTVP